MKSTFLHRAGFVAALVCMGIGSQSCIAQPANPPATSPSIVPANITPTSVLTIMKRVADWQLVNPSASSNRYAEDAWTWGACYAGYMALAGISDDPKYRDAMLAMGKRFQWKPAKRLYHADDQAVSQTYLELYLLYRDPAMLQATKERADYVLANASTNELVYERREGNAVSGEVAHRWWWCDALFMGPPVWTRLYAATGDTRYLDFMCREWWATTDYLYDKDEHLYFRDSRYFTQKEANGQKVFWGRGNGWVMGGLVRVLQYLPNNHPDRPRFEKLFAEMSEKILTCQQPDGLWRASLLDPDSYPLKETSGSGFYVYAFAWGVNQGLLDRAKFEPAVRKGWAALVDCVDADGKLTHVQPVGADPKKFDNTSSDVYGPGAFLLAGSEVYRRQILDRAIPTGPKDVGMHAFWQIPVKIMNPSTFGRSCETIEFDLSNKGKQMIKSPGWAVMDGVSSRILDSQVTSDKLLFQVDLAPGETRTFYVLDAATLIAVPPPIVKTFARYVPERVDDFAWESDRVAHRMYGQAVIKTENLISSGIDAWEKRTRSLVIDRWYKNGDYHNDHGEGMDSYRVGRSRGDGGLGIWDGKNLFVSGNYQTWKLITTGPIRSEFELTFDAWDAGGRKISETKRISIDAGSNMSRAESIFSSDDKSPLEIGVGIAKRPIALGTNAVPLLGDMPILGHLFRSGVVQDKENSWQTYWQPTDRDRGNIALAIVLPNGINEFVTETNSFPMPDAAGLAAPAAEGMPPSANLLAIAPAEIGKPFVYYFGAGWSLSGDFPNPEAWNKYVSRFAERLKAPLQVTVGN